VKLGIATTSYMGVWRPTDTYQFLEHCHALGAAGIQAGVHGDIAGGATTRAAVSRIRNRTEQTWHVRGKLWLSCRAAARLVRSNKLSKTRDVGAVALRAASLGTRCYEVFATLDAWQQHLKECHESIAAALPFLDKYKIPLGLENHKDWTDDEIVALMKKYSSEYFGVCLPFGSSSKHALKRGFCLK
jgi:3-oxoisoapionate decarboxylase